MKKSVGVIFALLVCFSLIGCAPYPISGNVGIHTGRVGVNVGVGGVYPSYPLYPSYPAYPAYYGPSAYYSPVPVYPAYSPYNSMYFNYFYNNRIRRGGGPYYRHYRYRR